MTKNNKTQTVTASDLALLRKSDRITADTFGAYAGAVREIDGMVAGVQYGATLVYMAARSLGFHVVDGVPSFKDGSFVAKDYAATVGMSEAQISGYSLFALAVDMGVTPEAKGAKDRARWSQITQRKTSAVRKALKSKDRAALDAALAPAKRSEPKPNDGTKDGAGENETGAVTVTLSPVQAVDGALQAAFKSLDAGTMSETDRTRLVALISQASARLAAPANKTRTGARKSA